eukprot:764993-Rhodomonas_salina.1
MQSRCESRRVDAEPGPSSSSGRAQAEAEAASERDSQSEPAREGHGWRHCHWKTARSLEPAERR